MKPIIVSFNGTAAEFTHRLLPWLAQNVTRGTRVGLEIAPGTSSADYDDHGDGKSSGETYFNTLLKRVKTLGGQPIGLDSLRARELINLSRITESDSSALRQDLLMRPLSQEPQVRALRTGLFRWKRKRLEATPEKLEAIAMQREIVESFLRPRHMVHQIIRHKPAIVILTPQTSSGVKRLMKKEKLPFETKAFGRIGLLDRARLTIRAATAARIRKLAREKRLQRNAKPKNHARPTHA